jgi:16S rRNA (uracil1498-N3)-methyltransferase
LDELPGAPPLSSVLPATRSVSDEIALMIGPEGGWTEEEHAAFVRETQWTAVSLGPLILRAETAAIAALAVIRLAWLH